MLQVDNLRRIEQQTPRDEFLTPAEFYVAVVGFLRRQFCVIRSALLVSLALGAVYIFASPAIYTGRATLIVDASKTQLFQSQQSRGSLPVNSAIVDTQIQILTSDDLALSVIKSLNLENDPEFTSPRTVILGAVTEFAGEAIKSVLNIFVLEVSGPSIDLTAEFRALRTFQKRLKVKRMALTYAIEIAFASHNPYRAAQIANAIADAYDQNEMRELRRTIFASSPVAESRLITHARPPPIKSWPDPLLVMALATLGGLIFGAAIGMLRDVSDRVFRNPLQIDEHLHADCVAVVPLVKARGHERLGIVGSPNRQQRGRRRRTIGRDKRLCWTVINSPISRFTEAIRAVKVAADRGN